VQPHLFFARCAPETRKESEAAPSLAFGSEESRLHTLVETSRRIEIALGHDLARFTSLHLRRASVSLQPVGKIEGAVVRVTMSVPTGISRRLGTGTVALSRPGNCRR
jgi:hypothetical protein